MTAVDKQDIMTVCHLQGRNQVISIPVLFSFALVIIAPIPEAKVCRKYICDKIIQSVAVLF
jgi:hypothetical protein